jgi:hypothetical protein
MKVNIPTDWIMSKSHLEEGHEIGAGRLPPVSLFGIGGHPRMVYQQEPDECVRCSVASLLGMRKSDVPNFFRSPDGWAESLSRWLKKQGLKYEAYNGTLPCPAEWCLAYGSSTPTTGHMVVMRDGAIWHDPLGCGIERVEAWLVIIPQPNAVALAPPPQRLASKKDAPGG